MSEFIIVAIIAVVAISGGLLAWIGHAATYEDDRSDFD